MVFACLLPCLFLLASIAANVGGSVPDIGVSLDPVNHHITLPKVVKDLEKLNIHAVRLKNPSPSDIGAFAGSGFTVQICISNDLVSSFAVNSSLVNSWIADHIVSFYPSCSINAISMGDDFVLSPSDVFLAQPGRYLIMAMRNLKLGLIVLGLGDIRVSTGFDFETVLAFSTSPSHAQFKPAILETGLEQVLEFLGEEEEDGLFMISVYPFFLYPKLLPQITEDFALFNAPDFSVTDEVTGVSYSSLYQMMVDCVFYALSRQYYSKNLSVVVITGWPSRVGNPNNGKDLYLKGVIKDSPKETGVFKDLVRGTYIFELFNSNSQDDSDLDWSIMADDGTVKVNTTLLETRPTQPQTPPLGPPLGPPQAPPQTPPLAPPQTPRLDQTKPTQPQTPQLDETNSGGTRANSGGANSKEGHWLRDVVFGLMISVGFCILCYVVIKCKFIYRSRPQGVDISAEAELSAKVETFAEAETKISSDRINLL